jgi:hypothetical protein
MVSLPAIAFAGAALVVASIAWGFGRYGLLVGVALLVLALWLIWRGRDDFRDIRSLSAEGRQWLRGAEGEFRAHQVLASLPEQFAVFHDYQPILKGERQRWNMDHLVVGPTGVFVVETKNYSRPRVSASNTWNRRNVEQTQRNAMDVKRQLSAWSGGQLDGVFVVPLLVYVQDGAFVERTREGAVHVVPLKWLAGEITSHSEQEIDVERAGRVVRVLYGQMDVQMRVAFEDELGAYGALSKQARYEMRDAAIAASASGPAPVSAPVEVASADAGATAPPVVCPLCGSKLRERTAKKGPRVGKRFLGCSAWSATGGCGFKHNLD